MRAVAIVLLVASVSGPVHADPVSTAGGDRRWHLGLEAFTDFPLTVGAQVWAELPGRLRLTTSFGELPDAYLDLINAIAVHAGAYGQSTADFISEALDGAVTWRFHVGWRPFRRRGFYFEAGYGILTVHKNIGLAGIIAQATSLTLPSDFGLGYHVKTLVQTVGVEVGWKWNPWRDLTLRLAVGFAGTVSADVQITPNFLSTVQQPVLRLAGDYVSGVIEKYLFIPTIGLAMGWQLF